MITCVALVSQGLRPQQLPRNQGPEPDFPLPHPRKPGLRASLRRKRLALLLLFVFFLKNAQPSPPLSAVACCLRRSVQVVYYNVVVKNDNGYTLDPPDRDSRMLTDMSEAEVLAVVSFSFRS